LPPNGLPFTLRVMYVVNSEQLPPSNFSREFEGADHGGVGVSLILVDAAPGAGPSLHRHDYAEILVVQEGRVTVFAGGEEREGGPGDIVVIPPGEPHRFVNSGEGRLRQLDIHLSPRYATEWLTS
jgi:quercetin dioxygenase-like cupin family protein